NSEIGIIRPRNRRFRKTESLNNNPGYEDVKESLIKKQRDRFKFGRNRVSDNKIKWRLLKELDDILDSSADSLHDPSSSDSRNNYIDYRDRHASLARQRGSFDSSVHEPVRVII